MNCSEQTNELKLTNLSVPRTITHSDLFCRGTGAADMKPAWFEGFQQLLASSSSPSPGAMRVSRRSTPPSTLVPNRKI